MSIKVYVKKVRDVAIPAYATEGAAAMDLRAALSEGEEIVIKPGKIALVPTGIAIAPESRDVVAVVAARSGLGIKKGVSLANGIGVIDADYRGEIGVGLINHGEEDFHVLPGDRIAQLMFMPVCRAEMIETENLEETERGAGGFGSTGIR